MESTSETTMGLLEESERGRLQVIQKQVEELRRSVIQSLQLAVYHSRTDDKTPVPQHGGHYLQKMMEKFGLECYWLGRLMALNNPPLQPDWKNDIPGMDEWDIFPKEIRAVSAF
ncbi:uncharacterized protein AKAME5_001981000 [Lates japonicus]|uniref:Uncharacterized protein n=1 Tax=Lates japonicus TaxID=270547 RepID=A0AAD3NAW4_LATJO|nr:uncharacterized protein AKAME5_001981000 [Lates japonicus]